MASQPYSVHVAPAFRDQLRDAPPLLQGYVVGIVAVLRVDPVAPSAAFPVLVDAKGIRTIVFADGRGFLRYRVSAEHHAVVLLDLTWL